MSNACDILGCATANLGRNFCYLFGSTSLFADTCMQATHVQASVERITLLSVTGKRPWAYKHNSRFWPAWVLTQGINCICLYRRLHWPLEMWYVGAYPGVGACQGHYGMSITCTQQQQTWSIVIGVVTNYYAPDVWGLSWFICQSPWLPCAHASQNSLSFFVDCLEVYQKEFLEGCKQISQPPLKHIHWPVNMFKWKLRNCGLLSLT
jgi:hypothetical protein